MYCYNTFANVFVILFFILFIFEVDGEKEVNDVELEQYSIELINKILPANYSKALRPYFAGKRANLEVKLRD